MSDEVFADGIGEITVTGVTVRVDLVSLSPTERDAANNPKPVFRQRVIMPVDAFVNSFDLMERVVRNLIDSGVVTRNQNQVPVADAPLPNNRPLHASRPAVSPNFS